MGGQKRSELINELLFGSKKNSYNSVTTLFKLVFQISNKWMLSPVPVRKHARTHGAVFSFGVSCAKDMARETKTSAAEPVRLAGG
jgi:hypothetical protein